MTSEFSQQNYVSLFMVSFFTPCQTCLLLQVSLDFPLWHSSPQSYPALSTPLNIARQASLSMEFPRQEYQSGQPFLSPGDLPNPGIKPRSPALQTDYGLIHAISISKVVKIAYLTFNSWFSIYLCILYYIHNGSNYIFKIYICIFMCVHVCRSVMSNFLPPPRTVVSQAPLSMGFPRQEYWSGLLFPFSGSLPHPGIELRSPTLQTDSLPSEPPEKPRN